VQLSHDFNEEHYEMSKESSKHRF